MIVGPVLMKLLLPWMLGLRTVAVMVAGLLGGNGWRGRWIFNWCDVGLV